MLSVRSRLVRAAAVLSALALLLLSSWRGSDDDFPFAPFHMFSRAGSPDGVVHASYVQAVNAQGRTIKVPDSATGLRRAELEGQLPRLIRQPDLLAAIAAAHTRRRPDEAAYVVVRVVQRSYQLHGGKVSGLREEVLSEWRPS